MLDTARSLSAEELTMPEVAKILGVKTPALYHHFSSREALIGEVGQQLFSDMPIPDPDSANWREWLHDINMRLYRFVLANPLLIEAADSAKGEKVFNKCKSCHKVEDGANALGPHLWGVVGRDIGSVAGFGYSGILTELPGNWDLAALDAFLTNPKGYANGTKMAFAGLKKPEDRVKLIVWLNEADGSPEALE